MSLFFWLVGRDVMGSGSRLSLNWGETMRTEEAHEQTLKKHNRRPTHTMSLRSTPLSICTAISINSTNKQYPPGRSTWQSRHLHTPRPDWPPQHLYKGLGMYVGVGMRPIWLVSDRIREYSARDIRFSNVHVNVWSIDRGMLVPAILPKVAHDGHSS